MSQIEGQYALVIAAGVLLALTVSGAFKAGIRLAENTDWKRRGAGMLLALLMAIFGFIMIAGTLAPLYQ